MEFIGHPAKFSNNILDIIKDYIDPNWIILDPFAGTGKLKNIVNNKNNLYLNEIEYEWCIQGLPANCILSNTIMLPFKNNSFDCIITSPTYGNRFADHHNAKDNSKRITYTHVLGRKLHDKNSGKMQWGIGYQEFHKYAWNSCNRVLKNSGIFILNISNHIRKGKEIKVNEWHLDFLINYLKYKLLVNRKINTPRMGFGKNSKTRVDYENLYILCKPNINN